MKKSLLVILADKNYVEQAKQLFSSVYWNAGWQGDYMLLSCNIPKKKLKWFRDKGILIKKCKFVLHTKDLDNITRPRVVFCKFCLFAPELKKWKNVVFLDCDIIVRGPLEKLAKIKGFAAPNSTGLNLKKCFPYPKKENYDKLVENYPLKGKAFNSGVIAFSTDVIKDDSFSKLKELVRLYGALNLDGDEPTLNLLFYKRWKKLPWIYNLYPHHLEYKFGIKPKRIKGIIIHFVESTKPWDEESPFYKEWKENLKKAELINIKTKLQKIKKRTEKELQFYFLCTLLCAALRANLNKAILFIPKQIDRAIGLAGIFLKKHSPKLYFKLKRLHRRSFLI